MRVEDALRLAAESDLDLVEVAPMAKPPVAKLMDFGKFKYEAAIKEREARKNQVNTVIKEIKFRPKIDPHDYATKKGHVERFLKAGDKVKVTIMFRGREQAHPERGRALLQKLFEDLGGIAVIESAPLQEGRNMSMLLAPSKEVDKLTDEAPTDEAPAADQAPAANEAPAPAEETPAAEPSDDAAESASEAPAAEASEAIAEAPAADAGDAPAETPAADASDAPAEG